MISISEISVSLFAIHTRTNRYVVQSYITTESICFSAKSVVFARSLIILKSYDPQIDHIHRTCNPKT